MPQPATLSASVLYRTPTNFIAAIISEVFDDKHATLHVLAPGSTPVATVHRVPYGAGIGMWTWPPLVPLMVVSEPTVPPAPPKILNPETAHPINVTALVDVINRARIIIEGLQLALAQVAAPAVELVRIPPLLMVSLSSAHYHLDRAIEEAQAIYDAR